jgi:hypothetical protein
MPKIVINPRIPNNIKIIEYSDYVSGGAEKSRELAPLYEAGHLIVLKGYKFKSGIDFFTTVNFPNTKQ